MTEKEYIIYDILKPLKKLAEILEKASENEH